RPQPRPFAVPQDPPRTCKTICRRGPLYFGGAAELRSTRALAVTSRATRKTTRCDRGRIAFITHLRDAEWLGARLACQAGTAPGPDHLLCYSSRYSPLLVPGRTLRVLLPAIVVGQLLMNRPETGVDADGGFQGRHPGVAPCLLALGQQPPVARMAA